MSTKCCIDGGRCGQSVDSNHQSIANHLKMYHGLNLDNVSMDYQCRWAGCNRSVPARALVGHIMSAHVRS